MVDFESNVGLVYKVYNEQFKDCYQIKDDLIQEGLMALQTACQKFDIERGVCFSTFAVKCIRNAMGMHIRKESRYQQHIACSLDEKLDDDIGLATKLDTVADEVEEPAFSTELLDKVIEIAQETDCYEIIEMKIKGKSQKEIAKKLGISQSRVSEKTTWLFAYIRYRLNND